MNKKAFILLLLLIFMLLALTSCGHPWATRIAQTKTTWQSETPFMQFTVVEADMPVGFGYVVDSNGEKKDICLYWLPQRVKFFVYLTNGETDYEKIFDARDTVLSGRFSYHNIIKKQVKLTIENHPYPDKLFNGLYDSIILTSL
jgi:hypothetical protein